MKTKASQNAHRGSDFRNFLAGEGILSEVEVEVLAIKRVISLQLEQILEEEHVTKAELASRMKTSRVSPDRTGCSIHQVAIIPAQAHGFLENWIALECSYGAFPVVFHWLGSTEDCFHPGNFLFW